MKNPYANIPTTVWLLVTITLISRCGTMVLLFLPLYLTQQLSFDLLTAGKIISFYGFGELSGAYIGGILADKLGIRRIQMLSFFLVGLGFLSLIILKTEYAIMAAIFAAGFFTATARPATGAAISKLTSEDIRPKAYALNYQAVNLGSAIGPILGGIFATSNYSLLFIAEGSTSIIAAFTVWIFFRNRTEFSVPEKNAKSKDSISILKDKFYLVFLSLTLLIGLSFSQLFSIYPVYLKNIYQLSEPHIGMILGLNGVMIILFQMYITAYTKKFNTLRAVAVGALLIGLGFAMLPFASGYYYAAFSMAIITIGEMLSMPLLFDYVTRISPPEYQGRYIGLLTISLMSLPLCIMPNISSYIYHVFSPTTLWLVIGFFGLVTSTGFYLIDKKKSPKLESSTDPVLST